MAPAPPSMRIAMTHDANDSEAHAIALSNRLIREGGASRRDLLKAIAALGAMTMLPSGLRAQRIQPMPRFVAPPFALGVASGYPRPDGVTLWTRIAPLPLQPDGGLASYDALPVTWQVAEDEGFGKVVAEGRRRAVSELAHAVHADVTGLRPDRAYFYRFLCGQEVSPTGRTRTAPAPGAATGSLRFALGSCQHWEQGYFSAYSQVIEDDPTLMLFVGDYLYRSSWGATLVRRHLGGEPSDLATYRMRHAQYKTDPDLQQAHGALPWLVTWDDHETDNDMAGEQSEDLDPRFLLRRAMAYQAYFEHMPLPASARPSVRGQMRLYNSVDWGDRARFMVLDNRQYRSPQACPEAFKGGGSTTLDVATCAALRDPTRTMLGEAQEHWLERELGRDGVRWNVVVQQTLMATRDERPGPGVEHWTDGWDGYPAARERFFESLRKTRPSNPLVVGGDIHATVVGDLIPAGETRTIASEICGTSITADGPTAEEMTRRLADNPHLKYGDGVTRGYVLFEVGAEAVEARLRGVANIHQAESAVRTVAEFRVENGRPGVVRTA